MCLLESAGGPGADRGQHVVAFGPVLTVSVTAGRVDVAGAEPLCGQVRALVARFTPVEGPALWELLRALEAHFEVDAGPSAFDFGFVAHFGYDTARYIERLPYLINGDPNVPDVHLVLYQGVLRIPITGDEADLLLHTSNTWPNTHTTPNTHDEGGEGWAGGVLGLIASLAGAGFVPSAGSGAQGGVEGEGDTPREAYVAKVAKCLGHIAVGDIYQVVVGHETAFRSDAEPVAVYARLRERTAAPYMFLAPSAGSTLVGASPELFVRVVDGRATMRPLAGTLPVGDDMAASVTRLSTDEKEIAEHVMLVDLCRNDISRICVTDTLDVPELLAVERFGKVLHLVSTVVGDVRPEADSYDVIAALFPAGTMTGAPKIRAMEIIEEVEESRRGMYAGALGLVGFGGYLNLALCIRALVYRDGVYRTRAAAGIVADSDPAREWAETLAKAGAAHWAVTGVEP
ncbi:anthranilate synthase component I family protein [Actinocorallia sp. API 0066]|nr:anthranilate synthase component I family protein [Actinocorallia sp. API 0066]